MKAIHRFRILTNICYNAEFGKAEGEVMEYFEWKEFPLQEEHDNP